MGETAQVKIGVMKPEDLDQVLAIEQASFTQPWSRQLFLNELRNRPVSTLLSAFVERGTGRDIAGYIIFWVVADEMHILNLATAPEYRRRGIARQLVQAALHSGSVLGARTAFLEVRASNTAAQKLYSGLGFAGMALRRAYYDAPVEDAVIMILPPNAFKTLVE